MPISLLGTFGAMYLLDYSLDNLSLMALIIATGFVVDDAIVVLENITRHIEAGMPRFQAAILGAREVGFTVLSMSLSLVAVFIPILMMGGIVGRLFREFSITLSVAVLVSLLVSLTTTPMMCSRLIRSRSRARRGTAVPAQRARLPGDARRLRAARCAGHCATGRWSWCCWSPPWRSTSTCTSTIPKGFFPQQDTGRLIGGIQADQAISFQSMSVKLRQFIHIVQSDPAVDTVVGFTGGGSAGGGQVNSGFIFVSLKPRAERAPVRPTRSSRGCARSSNQVAGARLFLQAVQDIRVGGRQSNAQYQYTLQADSIADIYTWAPKLTEALQHSPELTDVNSDQQQNGPGDRAGHRPRHRRAPRSSTRPPSTTRSTTPSASARSRPSTTRSTSITW